MFRYIIGGVVAFLLLFFWLVVMPYITQVTCPYCNGKAFITRGIVQVPCLYCKGAGTVPNYAKDSILKVMAKEQKEEIEKKKVDDAKMKEYEEKWKNETEPGSEMMGNPEPAGYSN